MRRRRRRAAKAAEEAAASSSKSEEQGQEAETGAKDGDGDTEAGREMKGFKSLGFTLVYKGNDIEDGIESYEKGCLDRQSVKDYGPEVLHITTSLHPRGRYTHAFIRINILIHVHLFIYVPDACTYMHVLDACTYMHLRTCMIVCVCTDVCICICLRLRTYILATHLYISEPPKW